jgi:hypothetical protein
MHVKAHMSARQATEDKDLQSRISPTRNVNARMMGPVPISPNTDQLPIPKRIDESIATYAKQRASSKTHGQAVTPETAQITPILPERISNKNFETTSKVALAANTANDGYYTGSGGCGTLGRNLNDDNRMNEDVPRDQPRSAPLDDDGRSRRSEYHSHCATTAPLTDDTAILPHTLDAS